MTETYPAVLDAPGDFYVLHNDCTCCEAPLAEAGRMIELGLVASGHSSCYMKRQPVTDEEIEQLMCAMQVNCMGALRYRGSCPRIQQLMINNGISHLCDQLVPPPAPVQNNAVPHVAHLSWKGLHSFLATLVMTSITLLWVYNQLDGLLLGLAIFFFSIFYLILFSRLFQR